MSFFGFYVGTVKNQFMLYYYYYSCYIIGCILDADTSGAFLGHPGVRPQPRLRAERRSGTSLKNSFFPAVNFIGDFFINTLLIHRINGKALNTSY
jgi:hypothetical protein